MHLTRYPEHHAGQQVHYASLLHHCRGNLSSKQVYDALHTSLLIALGFTEHTRDQNYLFASIFAKSPATVVLLVNNGAEIYPLFLSHALTNNKLKSILTGMTTARIIEAVNMYNNRSDAIRYTNRNDVIRYDHVHRLVNNELGRRDVGRFLINRGGFLAIKHI